MSTLTYVYFEYEPSFSSWGIWNVIRTKMKDLSLFNVVKLLNSQNTYEIEILSELWNINLYMNIRVTNWHIWSNDPRKMNFLTSFHFDTRLLTSKHIKLFSTYLVQRNNTMSKTCFSVPQNAKKNSAET